MLRASSDQTARVGGTDVLRRRSAETSLNGGWAALFDGWNLVCA